jgi:hypothetical protein
VSRRRPGSKGTRAALCAAGFSLLVGVAEAAVTWSFDLTGNTGNRDAPSSTPWHLNEADNPGSLFFSLHTFDRNGFLGDEAGPDRFFLAVSPVDGRYARFDFTTSDMPTAIAVGSYIGDGSSVGDLPFPTGRPSLSYSNGAHHCAGTNGPPSFRVDVRAWEIVGSATLARADIDYSISCSSSAIGGEVTGKLAYRDSDYDAATVGTLQGLVWRDTNRNGTREANEPPLPGVPVLLIDDASGQEPFRVFTDLQGRYTLRWRPGRYRVALESPPRLFYGASVPGADNQFAADESERIVTAARDVAGGQTISNINAGVVDRTTYVSGTAWLDTNRNGVRDEGEPVASGVAVVARVGDQPLPFGATTDGFGRYRIPAPEGARVIEFGFGRYADTLRHPAVPRYRPTLQDMGDDSRDSDLTPGTIVNGASVSHLTLPITLPGNGASVDNVDAGVIPVGDHIDGHVWADLDEDGVRDDGEPALAGVSVHLIDAVTGEAVDGTSTKESGLFSMTRMGGRYRLQFFRPSGLHVPSPRNVGSDELRDSDIDPASLLTDAFEIGTTGVVFDAFSAGFIPPPTGRVYGKVWKDLNGNGVRESGEPAMPNISLWVANNSVTTDANGDYRYDLTPADGVRVELASDGFPSYVISPPAVNGANDSDFSQVDRATKPFVVVEGGSYRRDLGLITGDSRLQMADYFPLLPGAQWLMTRTANGAPETFTLSATPGSVNGITTALLVSSDGDVEHYTNDGNGLRLHRQTGPLTGGDSGDLVFVPPIQVVPASISAAGQSSSGQVTALATLREAGSGRVSSTSVLMTTSSSAFAPTLLTTALGVLPVVQV